MKHNKLILYGGFVTVAIAAYLVVQALRTSGVDSGTGVGIQQTKSIHATERAEAGDEIEEGFSGFWQEDDTPYIMAGDGKLISSLSEADREKVIAAMIRNKEDNEGPSGLDPEIALEQVAQPDFQDFVSSAHIAAYSETLNDPTLSADDRKTIIRAVQGLDRRDYMQDMASRVMGDGTDEAVVALGESLATSDGWTSVSTYLDIAREHFENVRNESLEEGDAEKWKSFLDSYVKNLPSPDEFGITDETTRVSALSSYFREDPDDTISDLAAETLVYLDSPNAITEVVKLLQTSYAQRSAKHDILMDKMFHFSGPRFKAVAAQLNKTGRTHESVRDAMQLISGQNTNTPPARMEPAFLDQIQKLAEGCAPCDKNKE